MKYVLDSCVGFKRPVIVVTNATCWPSGDQAGPPTRRLNSSASMGTGFAAGFVADATCLGSVGWRSLGEDGVACASAEPADAAIRINA